MNKYFHGGAPRLKVGSTLTSALSRGISFQYNNPGAIYDGNFVYVTTDRDLAMSYAGKHLSDMKVAGDLYEVEVDGEIELDPDFPPNSWRCKTATVVEVLERGVKISAREIQRGMSPYQFHAPGLRAYDNEGYLLPSPSMAKKGIDREFLKMYGPWVPAESIRGDGFPVFHAQEWPDRLETFLRVAPILDTGHQITLRRRGILGKYRYGCKHCKMNFEYRDKAVFHQIGVDNLPSLARKFILSAPAEEWYRAAKLRKPARWEW